MKKIIAIITAMFFALSGYAQQDAVYNHYMFNELLINPAYAGTKGLLNANAIFATQWTGFSGSPTTQTLSLEGPVTPAIGLGVHFINDKLGAQSTQGLFGSYSYKVKLGGKLKLSMGLAVGVSYFTLDGTKLISENNDDPAIPKNSVSTLLFDSKAGLFLYSERFYAGFSVTNMLGDVIKPKDILVTGQSRHYFLTSGYVFDIGSKLKLKPSVLYKEDFRAPSTFDLSTFLLYNEKIWIGATVRTGAQIFKNNSLDNTLRHRNAIVIMTEWNITDKLRIGYGYTQTLSALKNYSGHEIMAGYYFPVKEPTKMKNPRYF